MQFATTGVDVSPPSAAWVQLPWKGNATVSFEAGEDHIFHLSTS